MCSKAGPLRHLASASEVYCLSLCFVLKVGSQLLFLGKSPVLTGAVSEVASARPASGSGADGIQQLSCRAKMFGHRPVIRLSPVPFDSNA